MKTVLITVDRYRELYRAEEELVRLESGGVDNWQGYGEYQHQGDYPTADESLIEDQKEALAAIDTLLAELRETNGSVFTHEG